MIYSIIYLLVIVISLYHISYISYKIYSVAIKRKKRDNTKGVVDLYKIYRKEDNSISYIQLMYVPKCNIDYWLVEDKIVTKKQLKKLLD